MLLIICRAMLFLVVVAFLSILGTSLGGVETGEWSVYSYPDSPLENPVACGRTEPSYVCDPNHLLPELDGKELRNSCLYIAFLNHAQLALVILPMLYVVSCSLEPSGSDGELIVYPCSMSIIFKDLLLRNLGRP